MSTLRMRACYACILLFLSSTFANAAIFTDRAAFDSALPGPSSVLDFESLSPGDLIASGDTILGIQFVYNFGGVSMQVRDDFDTTSPANFLGTDDAGVFQDGDDFDLVFSSPVNAIGIYFITADEIFDGEITLTAGSHIASLVVADLQDTLPDSGYVYFLGIIDAANPFGSATISTSHDGEDVFFFYNVDDIVTATSSEVVPEPSSLFIWASGIIATVLLSGRARKRKVLGLTG